MADLSLTKRLIGSPHSSSTRRNEDGASEMPHGTRSGARRRPSAALRTFLYIFAVVGVMIVVMTIRERATPSDSVKIATLCSTLGVYCERPAYLGANVDDDVAMVEPDVELDLGPVDDDDNTTEETAPFGKRKILNDHDQLVKYIKSSATSNVAVQYVALTPEEEEEFKKTEQLHWKDYSGRAENESLKVCLSCSVSKLVINQWGEYDACDVQRPEKPWCGLRCPLRSHCVNWYHMVMRRINESGGISSFDRRTQPYPPYVVKVKGGAYVTENGEIYNDEMVVDPRGHCSRKHTAKIRRRRARKFAYKKVYVVDFVWRGPYHEMADSAARIFFYHKELLEDPEIMIHTTTTCNTVFDTDLDVDPWKPRNTTKAIQTIFASFGINSSRIVTGDVYADEVITSQAHCLSVENLYQWQERRLRDAIHRYLWSQGSERNIPIGSGNILVIQRSQRRRITNHDELVAGLEKIAGGRKIEIYNDRLPWTHTEIWGMFYRADIVVAPHGAGLVNVVACRKNAAIYEIIQPAYENMDPANCNFNYKGLSLFMGLSYNTDFPLEMHRPADYFDEKRNKLVHPPTSMTLDLPRVLKNVETILRDHIDAHRTAAARK